MADTTTPVRIQRKRTPGWTLAGATNNPLGAVIVSRPSRFGNPFVIVGQTVVAPDDSSDAPTLACTSPEGARKWAAHLYDDWLSGTGPDVYRVNGRTYDRRRLLADLESGVLTGRDLACTCPLPEPGQPDHCHAAVLLKLANAAAGPTS
jgi:hypothetical protein